MKCYLRPLTIADAKTSHKWRNDNDIWIHTGSKPDIEITQEIEEKWLKEVLSKKDQIRFAICLEKTKEYIGNVQLTNIINEKAQFHIFIGAKKFWGMKLGQQATSLIIAHAFDKTKITYIYLLVSKQNTPAIKAYSNCGFDIIEETEKEYKMLIKKQEKA